MEPTHASKIEIAKELLLASPPGEINDVFNDLHNLFSPQQELDAIVQKTFIDYNMDQLAVVDLGQSKSVISKYNHQENDLFFDPHTKQLFRFDPVKVTANEIQVSEQQIAHAELRSAVEASLSEYFKDRFEHGAISIFSNEKQIIAVISSAKFSPTNFWNGRWRSVWVYEVADKSLVGTIKVNIHYFEEGNVQLSDEKEEKLILTADNAKDIAAEWLKTLKTAENEFQSALDESYNQLAESTFKVLRRALPVTRSKVDWNKLAGYKLGMEIMKEPSK